MLALLAYLVLLAGVSFLATMLVVGGLAVPTDIPSQREVDEMGHQYNMRKVWNIRAFRRPLHLSIGTAAGTVALFLYDPLAKPDGAFEAALILFGCALFGLMSGNMIERATGASRFG